MNLRLWMLLAVTLLACGTHHPASPKISATATAVGSVRVENISEWPAHLDFKDGAGDIVASADVPNMTVSMFATSKPEPGVSVSLPAGDYEVDGTLSTTGAGELSATAAISFPPNSSMVLGANLYWPVSPATPELQLHQIGLLDADPGTACSGDGDCMLVNPNTYGQCCVASPIDLSQASWIAVSQFNETYRPFVCTVDCVIGANAVINDNFTATCVEHSCQKSAK